MSENVQTLSLSMKKPVQKLTLNLKKDEEFFIRLKWNSEVDLDLHALHAVNLGHGSKITTLEDILSCYNVIRVVPDDGEVGYLPPDADGGFHCHNGALYHSADIRRAKAGAPGQELMAIKPKFLKRPDVGFIEIPLLVTIHPENGAKFGDAGGATLTVERNDGSVLLSVNLTEEFASFIGMQAGSIIVDASGSHFTTVANGFNYDFGEVIQQFQ